MRIAQNLPKILLYRSNCKQYIKKYPKITIFRKKLKLTWRKQSFWRANIGFFQILSLLRTKSKIFNAQKYVARFNKKKPMLWKTESRFCINKIEKSLGYSPRKRVALIKDSAFKKSLRSMPQGWRFLCSKPPRRRPICHVGRRSALYILRVDVLPHFRWHVGA